MQNGSIIRSTRSIVPMFGTIGGERQGPMAGGNIAES
jgi:hypothetical protein